MNRSVAAKLTIRLKMMAAARRNNTTVDQPPRGTFMSINSQAVGGDGPPYSSVKLQAVQHPDYGINSDGRGVRRWQTASEAIQVPASASQAARWAIRPGQGYPPAGAPALATWRRRPSRNPPLIKPGF